MNSTCKWKAFGDALQALDANQPAAAAAFRSIARSEFDPAPQIDVCPWDQLPTLNLDELAGLFDVLELWVGYVKPPNSGASYKDLSFRVMRRSEAAPKIAAQMMNLRITAAAKPPESIVARRRRGV